MRSLGVCLSDGHRGIVSSVPALIFQLTVIDINRSELLVHIDVVVAHLVCSRVNGWCLIGEISLDIMKGGIEDTRYRPIPKGIVEFGSKKLVVLGFRAMFRSRGQIRLPLECKRSHLVDNIR